MRFFIYFVVCSEIFASTKMILTMILFVFGWKLFNLLEFEFFLNQFSHQFSIQEIWIKRIIFCFHCSFDFAKPVTQNRVSFLHRFFFVYLHLTNFLQKCTNSQWWTNIRSKNAPCPFYPLKIGCCGSDYFVIVMNAHIYGNKKKSEINHL